MSITRQELVDQLAHTEVELENAKSIVYRCDGVIQLLKHLISEIDNGEKDAPAEPEKPVTQLKAVEN